MKKVNKILSAVLAGAITLSGLTASAGFAKNEVYYHPETGEEITAQEYWNYWENKGVCFPGEKHEFTKITDKLYSYDNCAGYVFGGQVLDGECFGADVTKFTQQEYSDFIKYNVKNYNSSVYNPESTPFIKYGDINFDGEINADDALAILEIVVGLRDYRYNFNELGNYNGDLYVDTSDALDLLKQVVGLE